MISDVNLHVYHFVLNVGDVLIVHDGGKLYFSFSGFVSCCPRYCFVLPLWLYCCCLCIQFDLFQNSL